jgi:putative ABC transport system permease protein
MVPLARRNLLAEKGRFAISVAGVGFAVLLILTVLSLYRGWSRSGETFEQLPGQIWVTQHGTTDPFHSVSLIPAGDLEAIEPIRGVQAVVPVLSRQMTVHVDGSDTPVRLMALGIPEGYPVSDEIRAKFLPAPGEMIIDKTLSRQSGLQEGDIAGFGEVSLMVADVGPRSAEVLTPFGFVNFADADEIFGVGNIVTYGMVVAEPDASIADIGNEITATNAGLQVYTSSEFAKSIRKEIDESFIPIIVILVAIGFVVGAAVVGLTIYTATIERSREFGVMKAVGGSPGFLYRIVLSQSAILTTAGFAAGLAGAYVVTRLAERAVPEFATLFLARDIGLVFLASMLMAVIASFLPVRRINSIDPAVVFRA